MYDDDVLKIKWNLLNRKKNAIYYLKKKKSSLSRWNRTTSRLIDYRFEACTPDHRGSAERLTGELLHGYKVVTGAFYGSFLEKLSELRAILFLNSNSGYNIFHYIFSSNLLIFCFLVYNLKFWKSISTNCEIYKHNRMYIRIACRSLNFIKIQIPPVSNICS